jgi:FdhE protein
MTGSVRPLHVHAIQTGAELRRRLDDVLRQRPEWERWVRLYELVLDATDDPAWDQIAAATELAPSRDAGDPLLRGATISLRREPIDGLLRRLLAAAELVVDPVDASALINGAINQDDSLDTATATVAQLAAMPLLQAMNRRYGPAVAEWTAGYCPVCGSWPALVEQHGLEREWHLRCGRCGADWVGVPHRCVFCGEDDHDRLGSLYADEAGESRRVETCETCRGYVKVMAALRPAPAAELPLNDLAMLELELAALERDYHRPESVVALGVSVRLESGGPA